MTVAALCPSTHATSCLFCRHMSTLSLWPAMLVVMTTRTLLCAHRRLWLIVLLGAAPVLADVLGLSPSVFAQVAQRWGEVGVQHLRAWQAMSEGLQHASVDQQVTTVNTWMDENVPYISDLQHWHVDDYWATPVEFIASHGGDCEDFAIAKYFTLRALGVAADQLRITYVEAIDLHQAHMILAYYPHPGQEPLILDSLVKRILPASQRPDLVPVYSFNAEGLWQARLQGRGVRIGRADELDKWRDVLQRMASQQTAPMK